MNARKLHESDFPYLLITRCCRRCKREECQKYGPVVSLLVPKENPGRGQVVDIFS